MVFWWVALVIATAIGSAWAAHRWTLASDPDLQDCLEQLQKCREALAVKQSVLEQSVQLRTEQLGTINRQLTEEIRERQELEKALRISQQNYRSIVEDQTEMILRFTKEGLVTFANKAYCDRYGMTPEEAIGSNCFLNIHPDYRQAALKIVQAATSQEPLGRSVIKVQRPDGSQDWAEWNGRALYDVDGTHLGYQAIGRIVTDLVETQQRLEESELQYRTIVEDQSEMIIRFDCNGIITFANTAYASRLGLTREEVIGRCCFDTIHPDHREDAARRVFSCTAERPMVPGDTIRVASAGGRWDWVEWNGRGLYDHDGKLLGYQGVGRNVSSLIEAQQKLRESELRYRSIVEGQSELIMRFDATGRLEFANTAYMRANNIAPDKVTSVTIWDFVQPEDHPRLRAAVEALAPSNPTERIRLRIVRDGADYWEDWYGHALYNDDGQFLCVQAVGRDVTKLVQAEDELRKKEALLRHATRLSTLGEMVAVITHELRQPLYSINNFAFACEQQLSRADDELAVKLKSWNQDIIGQVERANAIIARLRGFARRSDSIVSPVSINTVAQESAAMTQFEMNLASVTVLQQLDKSLPDASIDRLQIEQVLVNLIRNAYEALSSANILNPIIRLSTRLVDDAIEVCVEDNGPGLEGEELESVFQPFSTTKTEGLGLGLAICRSIIEEHDGHIWAEPNHPGLKVKFTIPLVPRAMAS